MLEQKFLDRFDMERRIQSRLYCFGSGASDGDSGGSAAEDIVTMGLGAPAQGGNVSMREELAMNQLIDDMDMERRNNRNVSDSRDGVGMGGRGTITSRVPQRVSTSYFGDLAGDGMSPTFRDVSVGAPNLPPPVITGQGGEVFDSQTGNVIQSDASYFGDLGGAPTGMVPLNSAPVPTPPPPRFQTNAERDFYENLAAQGDAAMNQFRSEVRNLDNRGLLGDFIARGISNRGVPNFNPDMPQGSQIRGVTNTRFVDLPFVGTVPLATYTGLDNPNAMAEERDEETVPPVINPLTGRSQCPDGYVFDEDLQACRLKGRSNAGTSNDGNSSPPSDPGDMFYRRTSLDDAPANLPSGFDFDAANRRFTQGFAVRPSFFQRPPDLTGFTLL